MPHPTEGPDLGTTPVSKPKPFAKRTVSYWLICGGKHSSGHGDKGGIINPGVEHWHRAKPYAVRCSVCAKLERIAR